MRICLICALLGCLGTACAPFGVIYHDVKAPPESNSLTSIDGARNVTKTGKACAQGVLGLVAWGDASQEAAARNGGIKKIHSADETRVGVLTFIYRQYCTVVSGE